MRIFSQERTGVIGRRLVPLLLDGGHTVAGMTPSARRQRPLTRAVSSQLLAGDPVLVEVESLVVGHRLEIDHRALLEVRYGRGAGNTRSET